MLERKYSGTYKMERDSKTIPGDSITLNVEAWETKKFQNTQKECESLCHKCTAPMA